MVMSKWLWLWYFSVWCQTLRQPLLPHTSAWCSSRARVNFSTTQSQQSAPGSTLTAIVPTNWKSPLLLPFLPQQQHLTDRDWMFVSPQNAYVEILTPNVMAREGRTSERWLSHEVEVLITGVHTLIKETPESSLTSFLMWGCSNKRMSVSQEAEPTRHPVSWRLDLGLPSELGFTQFCYL